MGFEQLISELFDNIRFEDALVLNVVIGTLWLVYFIWFIYNWFTRNQPPLALFGYTPGRLSKLPRSILTAIERGLNILSPNQLKIVFLSIFSFIWIGLFVYFYFFTRPYVIYQSPGSDEPYLNQNEPITVIFNKPVNRDLLEFNISTNTPGRIEWVSSLPQLPAALELYRAFKYYPAQTILPNEKFVVYLVGIKSVGGGGGVHEHNLDFTAPLAPNIASTSIPAAAQDISVSEDLIINLDNPDYEAIEWEFDVNEPVEFEVVKQSDTVWLLDFKQELQQNTDYTVTAYRKIVEKDLLTGEYLSEFEVSDEMELTFTTVTPPNLEHITPKGKSVIPTDLLVMKFDEEMNHQSVQQSLTIEPSIIGSYSWPDKKTLQFTPLEGWQKETTYSIMLAAGAKTAVGGFLQESIDHSFTTVGKVKVNKFNPKNGTTGVEVTKNIEIKFDQQVDKKSAKNKFKISPGVSGKFSWKENGTKMVFNPKTNLKYDTKYTVTIKPGIKTIHGLDSDKQYRTKFTTQSETFMLNVPWYSQQEQFTCNVASTRMALAYKGIYKSEASIKSGLGIGASLNGSTGGDPYTEWINMYGTYWSNVADYVNKYRQAEVKRQWNIPDMLLQVRKGNPVILWWHNGWSDWYRKSWTTTNNKTVEGLNGMHSEVVIGYKGPISNPTSIIVRDPWRGTRYYNKDYFDNLWKDSFNRTAVIVK